MVMGRLWCRPCRLRLSCLVLTLLTATASANSAATIGAPSTVVAAAVPPLVPLRRQLKQQPPAAPTGGGLYVPPPAAPSPRPTTIGLYLPAAALPAPATTTGGTRAPAGAAASPGATLPPAAAPPAPQQQQQQQQQQQASSSPAPANDTTSLPAAAGGSSSSSLSPGAIAGIAVGCVVGGLAAAAALTALLIVRRRKRRQQDSARAPHNDKHSNLPVAMPPPAAGGGNDLPPPGQQQQPQRAGGSGPHGSGLIHAAAAAELSFSGDSDALPHPHQMHDTGSSQQSPWHLHHHTPSDGKCGHQQQQAPWASPFAAQQQHPASRNSQAGFVGPFAAAAPMTSATVSAGASPFAAGAGLGALAAMSGSVAGISDSSSDVVRPSASPFAAARGQMPPAWPSSRGSHWQGSSQQPPMARLSQDQGTAARGTNPLLLLPAQRAPSTHQLQPPSPGTPLNNLKQQQQQQPGGTPGGSSSSWASSLTAAGGAGAGRTASTAVASPGSSGGSSIAAQLAAGAGAGAGGGGSAPAGPGQQGPDSGAAAAAAAAPVRRTPRQLSTGKQGQAPWTFKRDLVVRAMIQVSSEADAGDPRPVRLVLLVSAPPPRPEVLAQVVLPHDPPRAGVDLAIDPNTLSFPSDSLLGEGAFGQVHRAVYQSHQGAHAVAVKMLTEPGLRCPDEETLRSFKEELGIMARLSHPNILRCYGGNLSGGSPFIVTELCVTSLDQVIAHHRRRSGGGLPLRNTLEVGLGIASGLWQLHPTIVHRDLKPQNVLLDEFGQSKVADFGLSRMKAHTYLSTRNLTAGTACYMSPEAFSAANVGPRSDIYSLGCLLLECVTGEMPWHGMQLVQIAFQVAMARNAPPLPPPGPDAPPELLALIQECLAYNPKERPSSGEAMKSLAHMLRLLCPEEGHSDG